MHPHRLLLVTMLLAAALACDDGGTPPGGTGTGPDTNPPDRIDDLTLAYDSLDNRVTFSWTARRDDDIRDRADRYDIRHGGSFPFDWEQSTRVPDPPVPLAAGSAQEFHLSDPLRGRDVYASIRALDAAGNESPAGSIAYAHVTGFSVAATCTHALTGAPVGGLDVTAAWRRVEHTTTGADGTFSLVDLSAGVVGVHIAGGGLVPPFHTFDHALQVADDVTVMYAMIPFQQPDSPLYASVLELLRTANYHIGADRVVKRWRSYPVPWYAPEFVNVNGLDYGTLAAQAAERWNTRVGYPMLAPAPSDPAVGVLFEFLPRSTMGIVNGVTYRSSDAEGYPVHDRINIVDDFADAETLYRILVHELGHTVRLDHLPAGFMMFSGQPLPADITDDEVRAVQLMLALPNGTVLDRYDASPPAP